MSRLGDWGRGWALVTGASGGLGEDVARLLAARGFPLVLTARSRDRLEALARELRQAHSVEVRVLPCDLAETGAPSRLAERVNEQGIGVEVLVNNAGVGQWGPYLELDPEEELRMVRLNVQAPTTLTRHLLPQMVERGYGRVLNVASTAAFLPGPLMSVYYATKAYLLSYSEALAEELRGTGVSVTCLCPGPIRTGFRRRASMGQSRLLALARMESDAVARAGLDGLFREKPLVVPGVLNKLTGVLPRFLPRRLVPRLVHSVQAGRTGEGDG